MIRCGWAARLCVAAFLLLTPAGVSLSQAASTPVSAAVDQSAKKSKKKTRPKSRQKILKGKHERHRRKPA